MRILLFSFSPFPSSLHLFSSTPFLFAFYMPTSLASLPMSLSPCIRLSLFRAFSLTLSTLSCLFVLSVLLFLSVLVRTRFFSVPTPLSLPPLRQCPSSSLVCLFLYPSSPSLLSLFSDALTHVAAGLEHASSQLGRSVRSKNTVCSWARGRSRSGGAHDKRVGTHGRVTVKVNTQVTVLVVGKGGWGKRKGGDVREM